jgi:hypothetical protein
VRSNRNIHSGENTTRECEAGGEHNRGVGMTTEEEVNTTEE